MGDWVRVAAAQEVVLHEGLPITVGGASIAVYRIGDDYFALGDLCPHQGCALSQGEVLIDKRQVVCPCHESAFDLATGAVTQPPATEDVTAYRVRRNGTAIELLVASTER